MTELTKETFAEQIKGKGITVVDFWAPWCGPCRMMAPVLAAAAVELPSVSFAKVNVDENGELASEYGVMSIPTLIFFRDGRELSRSVGLIGKPDLLRRVTEVSSL